MTSLKTKIIKKLIKTFAQKEECPACPICNYNSFKEYDDADYWLCGNCGYTFGNNEIKQRWIGTANRIIVKICFLFGYENAYLEPSGKIREWNLNKWMKDQALNIYQ